MAGIMRAGYTTFLISPGTSQVALEHVLSISNVSHVILDESDVGLHTRLMTAISHRNTDNSPTVTVSHTVPWLDMFPTGDQVVMGPKVGRYDMDSVALMIHSSGMPHFRTCLVLCNRIFIIIYYRIDNTAKVKQMDSQNDTHFGMATL